MSDTIQTLKIINNLAENKKPFYGWLFLRFISALFPILTVYLYSMVIKAIEINASFKVTLGIVISVFASRLIDNFTRLLSTYKLDYEIGHIQLDIHHSLVKSIKAKDKKMRHKAIQAIRNFSDAASTTLTIFKQPGIDSLVSFITIPIILFIVDFRIFILQVSYMATYYFIDVYTTEKYTKIKNRHNSKIESYYAKLQSVKKFKFEETHVKKTYRKLSNWGIVEWSILQNISVVFYIFVLFYLVFQVSFGLKSISDLVLVMGYITSTQVFLNNISSIKDSLADTKVALHRLLDKNKSMAVDYDDLTT